MKSASVGRFWTNFTVVLISMLLCFAATSVGKETVQFERLRREYEEQIHPLLGEFCFDCHSTEAKEGELDLEQIATFADVRRDPSAWQHVMKMLDDGEMPPADSRQPSETQRKLIRHWCESYLTSEALANAGDPGRVVLRRLNNDEYNYTVRDLTGVESLNATRQFPVDGAAGEGFTNAGSAQGMSPSLVQKYLDAAKEVAAHTVLLPHGIGFSPYTTRRDQTDELVGRIQAFYRQFTADGGGTAVNLQGIKFDTNQGGLLPLEEYLTATIEQRDALVAGRKTIEAVADERSLNTKYLNTLWQTLSSRAKPSSSLIDELRQKWRHAKPEEATRLAADVREAQNALWRFNSIGHIGHDGKPKNWMEAASPIVSHREISLQLPDSAGEISVFLVASDAGDGSEHDFVLWENPRLAAPNRTELALRDLAGLRERIQQRPKPPTSPGNLKGLLAGLQGDDRFGVHPLGHAMKSSDLIVKAPSVIEFRIPAEIAEGRTLVLTGRLDPTEGREGSVQLEVLTQSTDPDDLTWSTPVVVNDESEARRRVESAFADFRRLFPPALCYARIVPVDEVVTLTLFYRQDDHLQRLMLDDSQIARLDRMWDELFYVSQEPLKYQIAFEQIREFATQDRPDLVKTWAPLIKSVDDRASSFRQRLLDSESLHVQALLNLADRAWRRELADQEQQDLRNLHGQLRMKEISHEQAIRLSLARVLTSPAFLFRREEPGEGNMATPVTDLELASRLSYFLWSSMPDDALRRIAAAGELSDEAILMAQTRRMLSDPRTRRLAVQFACQWLHIRNFDRNAEKNEKLYPDFVSLRDDMYEETVRFFEDMFRNDGSILDMLDADHTFLNEALAKHYGFDWKAASRRERGKAQTDSPTRRVSVEDNLWKRVDGVRARGRGGVLGMATVLASQSGASRTSPILRGNWIYETLLGEQLPRPPANVPVLPDEPPQGLTARQLIEQHSSAAACTKCHVKIDPYGFALEQYDAIGRLRPASIDTQTTLIDGRMIDGIEGLRKYLSQDRRSDFVRQFCRKLLGYALGREVRLSDRPLIDTMMHELAENDHRFHVAVEAVVLSRQFRKIRGKMTTD